jgi:hypothetical protein
MNASSKDDTKAYDLFGWLNSILEGTQVENGGGVYRMDALESMAKNISDMSEIDQREYLKVLSPGDMNVPSMAYWISIIGREEERPRRGATYVAYIFKKDFSGVYLYLHQSAETRDEDDVFDRDTIPFIKLKKDYDRLRGKGFNLDLKLDHLEDLDRTEETTISYKYYERGELPPNDVLLSDLRSVITVFDRYNKRMTGSSIHLSDDSITRFSKETGFPRETVEFWRRQLFRKKNVIFQGPPGTGKTFLAEKLANHLVAGTDGKVEMVYFHPNYTYEDFIQGLRPIVENKILRYEMEDGIFKRFCEEAEENDTEPYVLMIDEINRAKLSRVFGELMYLLEYRDKEVTLGSGGKKFRIPDNVYLLGTMNTADRSIALVDHALRRRFTFITIPPNYEVLTKYLESHDLPPKQIVDTLKILNHEINDPKFEVGISFFMKSGTNLKQELRSIWQGELEPYLSEFFYDTPKKMEQFTWEALKTHALSDYA